MSRLAAFFCCLFLLGNAWAKDCSDWNKIFTDVAAQKIAPDRVLLSISDFKNDTEAKSDDWISRGLADLLIRHLNTDSGVAAVKDSSTAQFKIGGIFQHTQNWLRFFVQIKDGKDKLLTQFPIESPFPLHQQFFDGTEQASEKIFERIGRKKTDVEVMKSIAHETENVHAYENYIKGREALETYDPNKIEVALIWFQESRREDPHYGKAYEGLIDTYGFASLVHKQNGQSDTADLEQIEKALKEIKGRIKTEMPTSRFLEGHIHYVTGARALSKNKAEQATVELKLAVDLVPEDPVATLALAQAYAKVGDKEKAAIYQKKAEGMNSCLKE